MLNNSLLILVPSNLNIQSNVIFFSVLSLHLNWNFISTRKNQLIIFRAKQIIGDENKVQKVVVFMSLWLLCVWHWALFALNTHKMRSEDTNLSVYLLVILLLVAISARLRIVSQLEWFDKVSYSYSNNTLGAVFCKWYKKLYLDMICCQIKIWCC